MRFFYCYFVMNQFHHMCILCGWLILSSTGSLVRKLSLMTVVWFRNSVHKKFYHHGNNFFEVLTRSSERLKKQALATFFGFLFEPWCIRAWLLDGTSFPTWRCSGVWSEISMFLWTIECSSGIYELALYCLLGNLWNRFLPIGRSHRLQPIYCRLQGTRSSMD